MADPPDDNKPRNPAGRPSKWNPGMVEEAFLYCLEHHGTDRDLAEYLGIGYGTLYDYKEQYPEFSEAIKKGRKLWCQNGCGNIVRSLYKKAEVQIIKVPKIRIKKVRDPESGEMVTVERTVTMEAHVCWPDERAIEFILLNQDGENWKLRPDANVVVDAAAFAAQIQQTLKDIDELHTPATE
jgi:hypothetical protein